MRRRHELLIPAMALLVCGLAFPAFAHRLNVFAWVESGEIVGEAYFPGGGKAAACPVEILDASGEVLAEISTDDSGEFRAALPDARPLTIRVNAGAGHAGTFSLAAGAPRDPSLGHAAPATQPHGGASLELSEEALDRVLEQKLAPIRQQLARIESERSVMPRIIAGVGFILGIFGAASLAWGRGGGKDR